MPHQPRPALAPRLKERSVMKKLIVFSLLCGLLLLTASCSSSSTTEGTPTAPPKPNKTNSPSTNPAPTTSNPTPEATNIPSTDPPTSPDPAPTPAKPPIPTPASPYVFAYPDAVRGVYVTGWSAGGEKMKTLLNLLDNTELNAMVIDIKDDDGYITFKPEGVLAEFGQPY